MNQTSTLNAQPALGRGISALGAVAFLAALTFTPVGRSADRAVHGPEGKIFVASVEGDSQVTSADKIEKLSTKSVFLAQGTAIETKARSTLAMVFSNGTGVFMDQNSYIEVRRFQQEPFVPNRTDLKREPSVSQTQVFHPRGTIAVCTGYLAPGSTMAYVSPLGSIRLHSGRMVMESDGDLTKISLLLGEGTVRGGELDLGGKVLHAGEQAFIRPGPPGQANLVQIQKIPPAELAPLEEKAGIACDARKTVFFETDSSGAIMAVPVVPANLPVKATVSPSQLPN
jgi:hypothetical protein